MNCVSGNDASKHGRDRNLVKAWDKSLKLDHFFVAKLCCQRKPFDKPNDSFENFSPGSCMSMLYFSADHNQSDHDFHAADPTGLTMIYFCKTGPMAMTELRHDLLQRLPFDRGHYREIPSKSLCMFIKKWIPPI